MAPRPHAAVRERALAALLVLPAGCIVFGRTAAMLWRVLDGPVDGVERVHVLLPPGVRHHAIRGVQLHEGRSADSVLIDDVPCTDLPRALLDTCPELSLGHAVAVLDSAERLEPGTLAACRAQLRDSGHRNGRQLARALGLATGWPESVLESHAWVAWHEAGLPMPLMQAVIRVAGRFAARVDFLWPDAMLVVEVDGLGKYADRAELQREKARQNLLIAEGYVVLRFTWSDVMYRSHAVAAQVRRALMINS